ncbi:hypothetical protein FRC06_003713, partial [Ceratobasidium sp. 370]
MTNKCEKECLLAKKATSTRQKSRANQKAKSTTSDPGRKPWNTQVTRPTKAEADSVDFGELSHQSASEELYPEEEDELALDPLANEEDAMEEVDQLADEVEVSEPE